MVIRCDDRSHEDCHHCCDFKWEKGYGLQLRADFERVEGICCLSARCDQSLDLGDAQHRRFAFIVGNEGYKPESGFDPLSHVPTKDAKNISKRVMELGFKVHSGRPLNDVSKATFECEVMSWTRSLPENAEAMVFLSGHGMRDKGKQFFVPVDYGAATDAFEASKCVSLEWIQDRVHSVLRQDGLIMSFWDCCREDECKIMEYADVMRGAARTR